MDVNGPKLDSMFRIQTILLLNKSPKSGYDLAKELEDISGKKPSSGKIYPFLHELKNSNYIIEIDSNEDSGRGKTMYQLTSKGHDLVQDLVERMGNLLDARLEQLLEKCYHCGVQLFDSKVSREFEKGEVHTFCCEHCMGAFYT
ncbi:MAG: helix-turn-helix transcriptional regulator [Candidatus Heimdallarchaeota archaeon]|nr:helix-turn-helix transcriptional regulator [Candidatus Heimdallarchaeota archaeon]